MQLFFDNVQDKKGNAIADADIVVTHYSTGNSATIYSENDPIPENEIAELKTDADGQFQFFAPNGRYTITALKSAIVLDVISGIVISDYLPIENCVLAYLSDPQTVADNTAHPIVWDDVLYDPLSSWDESSGFVVPVGVSHAKATFQAEYEATGGLAERQILQALDGDQNAIGLIKSRQNAISGWGVPLNASSSIVPVSEGQVFTFLALQNSGNPVDIRAAITWVNIEWLS